MACFQIMFHDSFAAGHWSMARMMHVQDAGQTYVRFMFRGHIDDFNDAAESSGKS
jgi:hypothetical protein